MATSRTVLMLHEGLAGMLSAEAGDAFSIIGPWSVGGDWQAWLDAGHGRGLRVAISSSADRFDAALFDRLPDLRKIVVFGAGYDGIDAEAAERLGIAIDTAGALHSGEVADHAVGMIIALRRRLIEGDQWVRDGHWRKERMPSSRSMAGARIGIVGLGHIGLAIARRLEVFGCLLSWWGPNPKHDAPWPRAETLEALAVESDVLAVAAHAHDSTHALISRAIIGAMKPGALIVNVSRGFVIDEEAMIEALREGRLGGAGLDVFEPEPTDPGRWRDIPNLLLTPHSAGDTLESVAALRRRAVEAAQAVLAAGD